MDKLFKEAESKETGIALGICSGITMYMRLIKQFPFFNELSLSSNREIYLQILDLLNEPYDVQYERTCDTPVTIYIMALYQSSHHNPYWLEAATRAMYSKNMFWARKVAKHLLMEWLKENTDFKDIYQYGYGMVSKLADGTGL